MGRNILPGFRGVLPRGFIAFVPIPELSRSPMSARRDGRHSPGSHPVVLAPGPALGMLLRGPQSSAQAILNYPSPADSDATFWGQIVVEDLVATSAVLDVDTVFAMTAMYKCVNTFRVVKYPTKKSRPRVAVMPARLSRNMGACKSLNPSSSSAWRPIDDAGLRDGHRDAIGLCSGRDRQSRQLRPSVFLALPHLSTQVKRGFDTNHLPDSIPWRWARLSASKWG
jgi:hypothetical protein